jgi:hypothetical protein
MLQLNESGVASLLQKTVGIGASSVIKTLAKY